MNQHNVSTRMILLVLFLGVLMGALDIAIVGPALHPIKAYFAASQRDMTWIFSIYILTNLVGLPFLSRLSDLFGRRLIYLACIVLFAAGSLLVASAEQFGLVILGRAIQGFGAGGIFPVASAVIGDVFPPERRGRALGLIGAVWGIAFIVGPILGGVLLIWGWKWIFLINLPIAILLIGLVLKYLPRQMVKSNRSFDLAGTVLLSAMLTCFVFGINEIDTHQFIASFLSLRVWPYLLAALGMLAVLILVEQRVSHPAIDPLLFRSRELKTAWLLAFGAGVTESVLMYIPLQAIAVFAVSESASAFLLLPLVLAMAVGSPLCGKMLDKFGSRRVIVIGTATMAAGMLLMGMFQSIWPGFILGTVFIGFGISALLGAPIRYVILNETPQELRSTGQGLMAIFTSAGQLLTAAVIAAVISSHHNAPEGFALAYLGVGVFTCALLLPAWRLKSKSVRERNENV